MRRLITRMIGVMMCAGLVAITGCDGLFNVSDKEAEQHQITIKLPSAQRGTSGVASEHCVSMSDSIAVSIMTPEGATLRSYGQAIPRGAHEVAFENVTAPADSVIFSATIFSTTGRVLFQGDQAASGLRNGFNVNMSLQPISPVLQACPGTVTIKPGVGVRSAGVILQNIGLGPLNWEIANDGGRSCRDPNGNFVPCFEFSTFGGTILADSFETLRIFNEWPPPPSDTLQVLSDTLQVSMGWSEERVHLDVIL